ncbi:MAG: aminotransferase class III-fold pyridoxal phosphate-dependent enzyme [Candidatus Nanohaloarchaea archaeon]|nr:aminotransferase class III-fold pyridoxal phosphate-dependent enzyme [Candidatus Nanohaloarchaea archaeon]
MLDRIRELLGGEDDETFQDYKRVLLPTTREEIVITAGDGPHIDIIRDGEEQEGVMDATSQVGTTPFGHRYEPLLEEIRPLYEQDSDFPLMIDGQGYYHPLQRQLAEELTDIYPGNLSRGDLKVYYCNSGSEAVERGCLKAAQLHRGGNSYVAFKGAFHGRTSLALSHTTSKPTYTEGFNFLARTFVAPYASKTGGELHQDPQENAEACLAELESRIKTEGPDNINSVLLESLQGEGGYNVPHPRFMQGVRELTREHGIPMIVDEVQAAFRTGEWFGIENFDVQPDMIPVSKTFSGGVEPFGASLIKDEFATDEDAKHSGTYGGNAKECFVALKTIELIRDNHLLQNAEKEGNYLKERFDKLEQYSIVEESRGIGLFRGIEFRRDGEPSPELRDRVLHTLLDEHDVLAEPCGNDNYNTAIRFLLPLTLERRHARELADAVEEAVKEHA